MSASAERRQHSPLLLPPCPLLPCRPENMDILKGTIDPWQFEFEDKREFTVARGGSGAARSTIA